MSDRLRELVTLKLKDENLSLRQAGKQADVAHTTIDRVRKGEQVDLDTVQKICEWVGIPVTAVLDVGNKKSEMADEVAALFALNEEFSEVFSKIAEMVKSEELDTDILKEITAFASFRMHERLSKKKK